MSSTGGLSLFSLRSLSFHSSLFLFIYLFIHLVCMPRCLLLGFTLDELVSWRRWRRRRWRRPLCVSRLGDAAPGISRHCPLSDPHPTPPPRHRSLFVTSPVIETIRFIYPWGRLGDSAIRAAITRRPPFSSRKRRRPAESPFWPIGTFFPSLF